MTEISQEGDETIIELSVNCPDEELASTIAQTVLSERLAAAANIHPPINSVYRWRGGIERAREVPLVLKTRRSLFGRLAERIAALHPYETPSLTARDVAAAHEPYRLWVNEETMDKA